MTSINVAGDSYFEIDGQLHQIKEQLRQKSGYPHDLESLRARLQDIIDGNLERIFISKREAKANVATFDEIFEVDVNYDLSLEDLIAAPKFANISRPLTKLAKSDDAPTGQAKIKAKLFPISSYYPEEAEECLVAENCRVAILEEFLAFVVQYRKIDPSLKYLCLEPLPILGVSSSSGFALLVHTRRRKRNLSGYAFSIIRGYGDVVCLGVLKEDQSVS